MGYTHAREKLKKVINLGKECLSQQSKLSKTLIDKRFLITKNYCTDLNVYSISLVQHSNGYKSCNYLKAKRNLPSKTWHKQCFLLYC